MDSKRPPQQKPLVFGKKNTPLNMNMTWSPRVPPNPFGYSFSEAPAPPPPVPVRGEALLNDTETNKFHNFFNQMEVGHFDEPLSFDEVGLNGNLDDYLFGGPLQSLFPDAGGSLHFSNGQSTAPAPDPLMDLFTNPFVQHQQNPFPHETAASPTVIAAASSLMHNSNNEYHHGHNREQSNSSYDGSLRDGMNNLTHRESVHSNQRSFASESSNLFASAPMDLYTHAMASGVRDDARPTNQAVFNGSMPAPIALYTLGRPDNRGFPSSGSTSDLQWGSDGHFGNNEYVPPSNQESVAHVTHTLAQRVSAFGEPTSATTTQPSSPIAQKPKRKSTAFDGDQPFSEPVTNDNGDEDVDPTRDSKVRKRRKTKSEIKTEEAADEDDHDDYEEPKQRRGKRQKRGSGKAARPSRSDAGPSKRHDSDSKERKTSRDNLTEEQRRENHILSEQKRRNLIKQGFDDLSELVPGLQAGGFSKSVMLTQAVEWLEELLAGNAKLRETLAQLGGA